MLHFPSSRTISSQNGAPRRSDSLNATQQKASANPIFMKIEEELHDARRVHAHGQEEDLRYALNMVINRVTELSTLLSEAYKTQADLEVQLNVAKSNLKLVISNNEMLEDALRRDTSGQSKDVGWMRRSSGRESDSNPRASLERTQSIESNESSSPPSSATATTTTTATPQDTRFFKFRFNSGSSSRPSTPSGPSSSNAHHLTSPSMPVLPSHQSKEIEELTAELEKEKAARKSIIEAKAELESELESLSQALFEEANKMVATERMKRAETEEELKTVQQEKEALKSALKLIEGENVHLRASGSDTTHISSGSSYADAIARARSDSTIAIKSRPESLELPPLPPSPSHDENETTPSSKSKPGMSSSTLQSGTPFSPEEESQPTPRYGGRSAQPISASLPSFHDEPSPWADARSQSSSPVLGNFTPKDVTLPSPEGEAHDHGSTYSTASFSAL